MFDKLAGLGLPPRQFVVVGGAALTARGIRDTTDLDLVVTRDLFEKLVRAGWRNETRPNGKPGLHHGNVEVYLDVDCGQFERSLDWLLRNADEIDGVLFVDLDTLKGFKRSYSRPKDLDDLRLIDRYLGA